MRTVTMESDRFITAGLHEENPKTAFVNVNIVTMLNDTILADQTVFVNDGIIEWMGDSKQVKIPESTDVIDGKGKYLMPDPTE